MLELWYQSSKFIMYYFNWEVLYHRSYNADYAQELHKLELIGKTTRIFDKIVSS